MEDVNIAFDSFEFDDRLLSKLDAEMFEEKENSNNSSLVLFCSSKKKNFLTKEKSFNNTDIIKKQYYNLPLSINDLSALNCNIKADDSAENGSIKVLDNSSDEQKITDNFNKMAPNSCASPVLSISPSCSRVQFSSTPLQKNRNTAICRNVKEENQRCHVLQCAQENSKKSEFEYLDFDLFEDWDTSNLLQEKVKDDPSFLTLSQAVELIEEAHKAEELKKTKDMETASNDSIDLLNGETLESDKNLFPASLNLPRLETVEKKISSSDNKFTSDCKSVVLGDSKSVIIEFEDCPKKPNSKGIKSQVAQRLNFEGEKIDSTLSKKLSQCSENNLNCNNIEFDSDNSLDAILQQSFFENIKTNKLNDFSKKHLNLDKMTNVIEKSSAEIIDDSLNCQKKRGKFCRINESDSEEDKCSNLLVKQKKFKKRNEEEEISGKDFLDVEAEVSDQAEVTSDEVDEDEDAYEKSFVDDECYFTQSTSVEMTANYLESVKEANNRPGTFKIPKLKPYIVDDVFSQIPVEANSDYEIDSFCVNDVEYEERELSVLDVAEQVLEIERRSRCKRFKSKLKKKKNNNRKIYS